MLAVLAVLENRLFKRTRLRSGIWWALFLFTIAETAAVAALWSGEGGGYTGALVGGTMGLGALFVLLAHDDAVVAQPNSEDDAD